MIRVETIGRFIRYFSSDRDFYLNGGGCFGEPDFFVLVGDAVLFHKKRLSFLGFAIFEWMEPIRTIPAFEWARAAIGDTYIPDHT